MLGGEVKGYISTAKGLPFFYVIGDEDYSSTLEDLKQEGLSVIRMSDFCPKDDKFPSVDELIDFFRTSDVDYRDNKFVVLGLGEYLALRGTDYANKELRRLKTTTLGNSRVVLLLRGIPVQASKIIDDDARIMEQRRAFVVANTLTNISIKNIVKDNGMVTQKGIKNLLRCLEDGANGNIYACTAVLSDSSLFAVSTLSTAHSVIQMITASFAVPEALGTEEQWEHLLKDIKMCNGNLSDVFAKYSITDGIFDELCAAVTGFEYKNWLVFLYFKQNEQKLQNDYLKLVVRITANYEDFKKNILTHITEYSHKDCNFMVLYEARKKLVKDFPEADIAIFINANKTDPEESIYRYTDNTLLEKKMVIKWIAKYGFNDSLTYVYPALCDYLTKRAIECPVFADELTEYFDAYRKQKVLNQITDDFMKLVEKYASEISYARLPTRDNAIKSITDKEHAYLYWIDALGVEYLPYIMARAKKKGLSMHVDIARSDLPTITTINKAFFEQWTGKKYKEDQLDLIKHKEKGGYFFTNDEDPIHLPAELAVIDRAMETAAMELAMHNCKSFVIASDHGASRLAVIRKQEVPYETDTKGEHSGRCCKTFDGCNIPHKVEENGYIVLSDYGRFRGSRAANVEVHGGASLEEIVVPVITLTLKKQSGIIIKVTHPEDIILDRHNGITITLSISDVDYDNAVTITLNNNTYKGKTTDGMLFNFEMKDIKRAKTYTADVFDGENLIGQVTFTVKGKAATVNDDFDFGEF